MKQRRLLNIAAAYFSLLLVQWAAWPSTCNDAEKQNFLAQVEWLLLTSRTRTDSRTDNCKISIMIYIPRGPAVYGA